VSNLNSSPIVPDRQSAGEAARGPGALKLLCKSRTEQDGLEQLGAYMDKLGAREGWLVIFDRESDKLWEEKIYWKTVDLPQGRIHVVGC